MATLKKRCKSERGSHINYLRKKAYQARRSSLRKDNARHVQGTQRRP